MPRRVQPYTQREANSWPIGTTIYPDAGHNWMLVLWAEGWYEVSNPDVGERLRTPHLCHESIGAAWANDHHSRIVMGESFELINKLEGYREDLLEMRR